MRILWVKAGKLLPVDTGGKIRSYNLLKHLADRNETTLLSYYDGGRDQEYEQQVSREFPGAITINTGKKESAIGQAADYVRCLSRSAPYAVTKFTSSKVQRLLSRWDEEGRFDVMICDFLSASLNFPNGLKTPVVLFQHNVESALWQRQAAHEPGIVKRLVYKMEAQKMTRYETATVGRFHHVIAVSTHDRDLMSKMSDSTGISIVPTGVDISQYAKAAQESSSLKEGKVLFLGSMDWEANIDGVDYFCREIWPQVEAAVPGATFYIVGRNPHARVKKWTSDSVVITGRVESVLPYLREAAVFVVPLRIGGGTRLKIYEAMAAGKAVVSTTIGAEGLEVTNNQNILLADTSEGFAEAVIKLLQNIELRKELGASAADLAGKYDWSTIAMRFEEILIQTAIKGRRDSPLEELASVNS